MKAASLLRELHFSSEMLILPNVWDAASAALVASVGARVIATTSAGMAWACGYPDGDAMPMQSLLSSVRDICRIAGTLPVTVDIEGGYSNDPARVAGLVCALRDLGVSGINIEDGSGEPALLEKKIGTIKVACDVFVNARSDVLFRGLKSGNDALLETCARGNRYASAGADCFFVPGLADESGIARVARTVPLPLNLLAVPNLPTPSTLHALGVRRLSAGILISKLAMGTARRAAMAFLSSNFSDTVFRQDDVHFAEMNALFATPLAGK